MFGHDKRNKPNKGLGNNKRIRHKWIGCKRLGNKRLRSRYEEHV